MHPSGFPDNLFAHIFVTLRYQFCFILNIEKDDDKKGVVFLFTFFKRIIRKKGLLQITSL